MIHPLWSAYPDVVAELVATQQLLQARAQIRDPQINHLIQGEITAGGKMLRSGLMFMLARFAPVDNRQLVKAAAAIEALHLATLVHDDVLDDSPLRRGVPTVQTQAHNKLAIYAGDFLFSVYFDLLAEAAPDQRNVAINAFAMRRIFLGELDQNGHPHTQHPSVMRYLRQINGKTAALFALACFQGMRLSTDDQELWWLGRRYGHALGMAFQLIDDCLDFQADAKTAKPVLQDLKNGVYTLPVLCALQTHSEQLQLLLRDAADDESALIDAAVLIRQTGLEPARELADRYTQKALGYLNRMPAGQARDDLERLTTMLLKRKQ